MPERQLLTPSDLADEFPCWGLQFQFAHREAGDFIPHLRIGDRIFYRRTSVEKFLIDNEVVQSSSTAAARRKSADVADGSGES